MLSHEENERLCRVGPATDMGRMQRCYWLPALQSADLATGGARQGVRLLGQDFVAFRDTNGAAGLCEERSHARVERSYPVIESGGFVWAYLGPPATEPAFPDFAFTLVLETHRLIIAARIEANYVQCLEGAIDSAHTNYLHRNPAVLSRPSVDGAPRIDVQDTAYGFRYGAIRIPTNDPERRRYVRVTLFVAPFHALFPAAEGWGSIQMFVPIDDEHTMFYFVRWSDEPIDAEERARTFKWSGTQKGIDIDDEYRKTRTRENTWLQDRSLMENGGSFSGITGVNNEDFAVEESMGPLYDRRKEHLGASDIAVIRMRRLMLDSARDFIDNGTPPIGLRAPVDYRNLRGAEQTIPLDVPWQSVGTFPGELQSTETPQRR
jgi:phthalate 4,5-dioxygenase oxygenase subunit